MHENGMTVPGADPDARVIRSSIFSTGSCGPTRTVFGRHPPVVGDTSHADRVQA